jgi:hypothetical protein
MTYAQHGLFVVALPDTVILFAGTIAVGNPFFLHWVMTWIFFVLALQKKFRVQVEMNYRAKSKLNSSLHGSSPWFCQTHRFRCTWGNTWSADNTRKCHESNFTFKKNELVYNCFEKVSESKFQPTIMYCCSRRNWWHEYLRIQQIPQSCCSLFNKFMNGADYNICHLSFAKQSPNCYAFALYLARGICLMIFCHNFRD